MGGMKRHIVSLVVLAALIAGCVTNPIIDRRQLLLYSEGEMNKLGEATYAELTGSGSKVKLVTSGPAYEALQRVGARIKAAANKPDYKWEFRLIQSNKVNAWALPGGKIAFYTGIFPILQDEAGMAIVMGHEIMHAILQHGNERMSQGALANLAVTAAAIGLHDHEYRNEIAGALGAGITVGYVLPFSREHESEADEHGLYLAAKAGYDPEAAIGVWERMDALSKGKRKSEFLSTHPHPQNRIKAMRAVMPKATQSYEQAPRAPNQKLPDMR